MKSARIYPGLCIHFDHHPHPEIYPDYGKGVTLDMARRFLHHVRPDVVQVHAIGTYGYTSYPSAIGTMAASVVGDPLAVWKAACEAEGVRFGVYCSPFGGGRLAGKYKVENRAGEHLARNVCPNKPYLDEFLIPLVQEIIARYAPGQIWFDNIQTPWNYKDECVCQCCRDAYRKHFGGELPPAPEGEAWRAVEQFTLWTRDRVITRLLDVVHRLAPDTDVSFNFIGFFPESVKLPDGLNRLSADCLNDGNLHRAPLQAGFIAGHPVPSDIMLFETILAGSERFERSIPQLLTECSTILAHGHRVNLWLDPEPDGAVRADKAEKAAAVAELVRARQDWCVDNPSVADVAVFLPVACRVDETEARNTAARAAARLLRESGVPFDWLFEYRLETELDRYRLVVVPEVGHASPESVARLKRYVEKGGIVLAAPCPQMAMEDAWLAALTGGGCRVAPDPDKTTAQALPHEWRAMGLVYSLFQGAWERLDLPRRTKRTEAGNTAAPGSHALPLYSCRVGKGRLLFLPGTLFSAFDTHAYFGLRDLVADAVLEALGGKPLVHLAGYPGVEVVANRRGNDLLLHLVNLTPGLCTNKELAVYFDTVADYADVPVSLRLPNLPATARLLPDGGEVAVDRQDDGCCRVTIPRLKHHVAVRFAQVYE
jgi:hypothetical protein